MDLDRKMLKEYFKNKQAKSNRILERVAAVLERRQEAVETSLEQSTELVERNRQLQQADAEARRAKHEWRRTDQELSDAEDRRDAAADRLEQFRRAVTVAHSELENKTANYRKATSMLKTHMGIEVRRRSSSTAAPEPGAVTRFITLTRVDEHDAERPFHVQYTVSGSSITLVTTKPSLADLPDLQSELDASGNLGQCMAQLRSRFQQLARQQAERRERRAARAAARTAPARV